MVHISRLPPMLKPSSTLPIIFTDLDGSLLDHYTYSFSAAVGLLKKLESLDIPVVPVTSKTYCEVLRLRDVMDNQHPFITENGAAIFIPRGYFSRRPSQFFEQGDFWVYRNCQSREYWLRYLDKKATAFAAEFETFSSIVDKEGIQGLVQLTGLSTQQATLSHRREHSEPILWTGTEKRKKLFIETLSQNRARLLQGGRFLSLGGHTDKGKALLQLQSIYAANHKPKTIQSLAIGDGINDTGMLEAASCALIIKSTHHQPPVLTRVDNTLLSSKCGPQGWVEGVSTWLKTFTF